MSREFISLWASGDSGSLLRLARDIETNDSWRGFLTIQEHDIFQYAIDKGGDVWHEFINGNVICRLEQLKPHIDPKLKLPKSNGHVNGDSQNATANNTPSAAAQQTLPTNFEKADEDLGHRLLNLDPVTVAFRVRYMLYEKSIQIMFPSPDPDVSPDIDYKIFETENRPNVAPYIDVSNASLPKSSAKRAIDDDYDDYDDDEDSKDDDNEGSKAPATLSNGEQPVPLEVSIEHDPSGKHIITIPNRIPTEEDLKRRRDAFRVTIDRIYHIFEEDEDNLQKKQKLEESDRQIESDILDSAALSGKMNSQTATFGAANLSLKHLLSAIQSKQDVLNITERELSSLLSDVRKNRSKWASEDKIGQEELYEAAEKVVQQLRATTEHSTAFLNKVNKRDAPNYFSIIKHPMDLNTVMKKLRSFQYHCKKDFVDDLMLIWNNCLTYNTDPNHYLRHHAIEMKNKTLSLIPLIPDITIRDRSEVEAEEARLQQLEDESEDDAKVITGKHTTKGKKRKLHHDEPESQDKALSSSRSASNAITQSHTPSTEPPSANSDQPIFDPYTAYDQNTKYDPELNFGNIESLLYQEIFGGQALRYVSKRSELFKDNRIQLDCPALLRDSRAMGKFEENELDAFKTQEAKEEAHAIRKSHQTQRRLIESVEDLGVDNDLLVEYNTACGLPEFPWNISTHNRDEGLGNITADDISQSKYVSHTGLSGIIQSNLEEIQKIRHICSKIDLIRQMQQQAYMHTTQFKPYKIRKIKESDLDFESRLPNRDKYDKAASHAALRRNVAKIAMHTGFEETETMAIDALTDVAADYLSKLGRSLMLWLESNQSGELTAENTLLTVLDESGIESISDLDLYVRDDLEKHTQRLGDHKKKLATFLSDLLKPAVELTDGEFNDGSQQFVTGDFSEEIGEDFFGFKSLGLEDELGLTSMSVPLHLLQNRSYNYNFNDSETMLNSHISQVPEYDVIDARVAEEQLPQIKALLLKKLELPSCITFLDGRVVLLEGEQLPPKQRNVRPKVPPTGKLSGVKRKPSSRVFFLSDDVIMKPERSAKQFVGKK